jgi:hypothetical protein
VHGHEGRQLGGVAEVVGERPARKRRARGRLARDHVDVGARDLVADEGQGEAGEVRAAADRADHHVDAALPGEVELAMRLLADHGLVQQDVVQHRAERVARVVMRGGVLDRLGDGDAEAAGRVGTLFEHRPARVRVG